jgi:ABC-2 type transport system permease protein
VSKKIIKSFFSNIPLLICIIAVHFMQLIYSRNVYDNFIGNYEGVLSGLCQMIILDDSHRINSLNFYGASTLVQLIFICGIIAATLVASDKENHTLTRIFTAPVQKIQLLLGYLTGFVFSIMSVALIYILLLSKLLGVFWGDSIPNILLITFLCVVLSVSFALLISTFVDNTKLVAGIMSILVILMAFLSGTISGTMQTSKTGIFTLLKWAFESYLNNIEGKALSNSFCNILVMIALSVIFFIMSTLFFERKSIHDN